MIPTIEFLKENFDKYNVEYFYSILPVPVFELINTRSLLGEFIVDDRGTYKIRITRAYDGPRVFFRIVLLHEMIHFYLHVIDDEDKGYRRAHGANFKREAARIGESGWNIQTRIPVEKMSDVRLVENAGHRIPRHMTDDLLSILDEPLDESQLIHLILHSKSKNKDLLLWFNYPEIQKMVYSELNEDDCPLEYQKQRSKAIIKAYKLLIDFNRGNSYSLHVLHNDIMRFYQAIGDTRASDQHRIEKEKYEEAASEDASRLVINGREYIPIKMRTSK